MLVFFAIFEKNFKTKFITMVNKLNLYQLLFAALFILKIGEVGKYADFSWWWVFLPFLLGVLHSGLMWVAETISLPERMRSEVANAYVETIRKKATKKAIKEIQRKQEEVWPK